MSRQLRGAAAIVGAIDIASADGMLDGDVLVLQAAAVHSALADAGLSLEDVDGIGCAHGTGPMPALELSEYLGIYPIFLDSTQVGGASYHVQIEHAIAAISAGVCETVAIVYARTPKSDRARRGLKGFAPEPSAVAREWEFPVGLSLVGAYAMTANRHMSQFGTTPEQLAEIAVQTRRWAADNPRAYRPGPVTIDEVLGSKMIASPLTALQCCVVTDGAGAIILTSSKKAPASPAPVYVLGAGSNTTHASIIQMPDLTVTAGKVSGERAFTMAGIDPSEVDVLQAYDSFTITVLLAIEDLGFCPKGEAGAFLTDVGIGPGGGLPTNTNGGGLAYTHPGEFGIFQIVEGVRQIRLGNSTDRLAHDGNIAVCHGVGGTHSVAATLVLGNASSI